MISDDIGHCENPQSPLATISNSLGHARAYTAQAPIFRFGRKTNVAQVAARIRVRPGTGIRAAI